MAPFIYGKTQLCIVCKKKATYWNGWLRKSRDGIQAGYCDLHEPSENKRKTKGFGMHNLRGIYNKELGFKQ